MTAPLPIPTIGAEAENQRLKFLLATTQSVLDATQAQLVKAVEENFRMESELRTLRARNRDCFEGKGLL